MFEKFIFHPRKNHTSIVREWKECELNLHLNKQNLQGWLVHNEEINSNSPFIIYYGGNAEDISLNLNDLGNIHASSFLLMNYRGYGGSSGKPTQKHLFEDAVAIYDDIVKKHSIHPSGIYLLGRSIGSSIASYVASQRKVGGLILVTPFDSLEHLVRKLFRWIPIGWLFKNSFNTCKYLSHVNCKILVLEAGQEEVIPRECLESLISAYRSQIVLEVIKDANHQDISGYEEYYTAINRYLSENQSG